MNSPRNLIADEKAMYHRLAEMVDRGEDGVLATVLNTRLSTPRHQGSKMLVHGDGGITGSIGGGSAEARVIEAARQVLADRQCRRLELNLQGDLGVCGGEMEVFLEPVLRSALFVVIGAGHVGRAVVELGRTLPFRFKVVDDRPEFLADLETIPGVQCVQADPGNLARELVVSEHGGLLIASRNHELDGDYLEAVLAAESRCGCEMPFLGILGSRTKAAILRRRFDNDVDCADRVTRIQMPVGVDLAAETPAEIALSVLAEALAVLRGVQLLHDARGSAVGVPLYRHRQRPGDQAPVAER